MIRLAEERERDLTVTADSKEELQQAVVVKMKAVTKAKEDLCIALLEENGYDLQTSIEAYFQQK
jgi:UBA-like domain